MNALNSLQTLLAALDPISDRIRTVSIAFMGLCFVAALIEDHFRGIQGESARPAIFFKALLFFVLLAAYKPFFLKVEQVGSGISNEIFTEAEFTTFVQEIWSGMNTAQQKLDGVWGVLKGGVTTVVITLSYMVAILAYKILQIGKLIAFGVLYVLGPLVLAASVLPNRGKLTAGLATNIIAIGSWPIVGNLLLRLLKEIGIGAYYSNPEQFVPLIAANLTFAFSLMMVPSICSALCGGGSLGSVGSLVGLSALTTAIAPVSYSWGRVRDMTWSAGVRQIGNVVNRARGKKGFESSPRPGDRRTA